ncbi:MAG: ParB/RepB/Spo0J family partition protein [Candidatus Omnitrophica bacterium]|nr:ParB/RepB/Spo0J family partition protein [Candidatus Omnitrophota bacterium]
MEKKSLGRGIEALIPTSEKCEKAIYIRLEEIKPNPYQARQEFDEESLQELCQSIQEKGLLQPVIVRKKADGYELIAGERRWRAAKLLNIKEIPAIIREADEKETLELSLIENLQRKDLNPIEEAKAFQYLIEKFGLTQEEISRLVGKSRVSITNLLRLLKLPLEIQEEIRKGRISFTHGRLLLEVEEPNQQRLLAQKIISKSLSIKDLENLIRKVSPKKPKTKKPLDPYLLAWQQELQRIFGTKVNIFKGKKHGFIKIEFYSSEELERLLELLRRLS